MSDERPPILDYGVNGANPPRPAQIKSLELPKAFPPPEPSPPLALTMFAFVLVPTAITAIVLLFLYWMLVRAE